MQKIKFYSFGWILLACLLLNGCYTYTGQTLQSSYKNIAELQSSKLSTSKIKLAEFTESEKTNGNVFCWIFRDIGTSTKEHFSKYIHNVLKQELIAAGVYDENSRNVLQGNLDKIDLKAYYASWEITMTFKDKKHSPYTITNEYKYSPGYIGDDDLVCSQAAETVAPMVEQFLLKLYQSPEFKKTLKN